VKPRVLLSPRADRDIDEQFAYLAEEGRLDTAARFLEATESAFQTLLEMPELGAPRRFANPKLQGLRMWPIQGFEKHLIFYRPVTRGIEIVRVLHAARDIEPLLEQEP